MNEDWFDKFKDNNNNIYSNNIKSKNLEDYIKDKYNIYDNYLYPPKIKSRYSESKSIRLLAVSEVIDILLEKYSTEEILSELSGVEIQQYLRKLKLKNLEDNR